MALKQVLKSTNCSTARCEWRAGGGSAVESRADSLQVERGSVCRAVRFHLRAIRGTGNGPHSALSDSWEASARPRIGCVRRNGAIVALSAALKLRGHAPQW
jgi:hypothetical protein